MKKKEKERKKHLPNYIRSCCSGLLVNKFYAHRDEGLDGGEEAPPVLRYICTFQSAYLKQTEKNSNR